MNYEYDKYGTKDADGFRVGDFFHWGISEEGALVVWPIHRLEAAI